MCEILPMTSSAWFNEEKVWNWSLGMVICLLIPWKLHTQAFNRCTAIGQTNPCSFIRITEMYTWIWRCTLFSLLFIKWSLQTSYERNISLSGFYLKNSSQGHYVNKNKSIPKTQQPTYQNSIFLLVYSGICNHVFAHCSPPHSFVCLPKMEDSSNLGHPRTIKQANTRESMIAKWKHKNLANRSHCNMASSEPNCPTTASPDILM